MDIIGCRFYARWFYFFYIKNSVNVAAILKKIQF